ncbi:MAG TPA: prepilin-type N-terminal cleavage/methylation domain-containing protein [Candidatus Paceibacterota bacterium]|nr:prepilin-type N-terminal cleavage/methylation domain-containing protein [Candidatus Paceibacterota bacterium]
MNNGRRGFTLIELLVVIAIIALLSSVVLASLATSRAKSRDAKRRSDLDQIRIALEMYYDAKGKYPEAADGNCSAVDGRSFQAGGCLLVLVSGGYISKLPADPLATSTDPLYRYDSWCALPPPAQNSNQRYRFIANTELPAGGLANNLWADNQIMVASCADPK